jgi:OOP family OmpA-OmpF porin
VTRSENARDLDRLRQAIAVVSRENVGDVLPEAAARASGARHAELAIAIEPAVTTAVRSMARRKPELVGEILAPTIGAAVRKAVSEAIASMLEHFNEALERSLSPQSVKWRLEARRTGRPFAEVVFLRTLKFRVEQVFLIDTRSSLVLQHVVIPELQAQAPDQVAAMLTAIDSFSREALGPVSDETHLDRFELGDRVVWVERAPTITVTAVIRGGAGVEFGRQLREVRERIFLAHEQDCAHFHGDPSPFEKSRPELESLLQSERRTPKRWGTYGLLVAAVLLVVAVSTLTWRAHARTVSEARTRTAIAGVLAREPGILLTSLDWKQGRGRATGLHDPLAPDPASVLARAGLPPVQTDFVPFVSLDPRLVEARARRALAPPRDVSVTVVNGGTLRLAGAAPRAWIDSARLLARAVPGVDRLDDAELRDAATLDELRTTKRALAELELSFPTGRARLTSDQEATMKKAESLAKQGLTLASGARVDACLRVTGHSDLRGTEAGNRSLREARARAVATRLEAGGVDPAHLRAGGEDADAAGQHGRTARFELDTSASCGGAP